MGSYRWADCAGIAGRTVTSVRGVGTDTMASDRFAPGAVKCICVSGHAREVFWHCLSADRLERLVQLAVGCCMGLELNFVDGAWGR